MSKNTIYCFSGSGNCLDIAKNIAKTLGDTDIVMMRKAPVKTDATDSTRVGFVFPCYAGGLPGNVGQYIKNIKVKDGSYTFGVVSYAGYMGCGMHEIDKVIPLNYWAGVSHNCSCIWLMPHTMMFPPLSAEKAQARCEKKTKKIAEDIRNGELSVKEPPKNSVNALESKAWPMLSKKKAIKLKADPAKCVGCGQCMNLCPKGNIIIAGGKAVFGADCIGCLSCLQYCPHEAISMGGATEKRERYHNPNVTAAELQQDIIHID